MKKKIVQDVIPAKKSIRDVELSSKVLDFNRSKKKEVSKVEDFTRPISTSIEAPIKIESIPRSTPTSSVKNFTDSFSSTPKNPPYKYDYSQPVKSSRKAWLLTFILFGLVLTFGLSIFFKSAEIDLTPRQEFKTFNQNFVAKKNITTDGLSFQVVSTTKDIQKMVDSTSQQKVEKKAWEGL